MSASHSSATPALGGRILLPLGFTAIALVALLVLRPETGRNEMLAAYLLFCVFYPVWIATGRTAGLLAYLVPALLVFLEFTTPFAIPFSVVFRSILPGRLPPDPSLADLAVSALVGSGLMEELMKSLPALLGLGLALGLEPSLIRLRAAADGSAVLRQIDPLRCSGPVQGLLIGLAAGAGFVYLDILYQVVPASGVYVPKPEPVTAGMAGLAELAQHVLSGALSHMVWTGLSGFFIGVAARRPRSAALWLAIAWLLPALLHAFWNVAPHLGSAARWLKVALPLLMAGACVVAARRIACDPHPAAGRPVAGPGRPATDRD
jgi:RsiW-degrading membrane proteinase PrsW (M82 family)